MQWHIVTGSCIFVTSMQQVLQTLQVRRFTAHRSRLGPQWRRDDGPRPYGRLYLLQQGACVLGHHGKTSRLTPGTVYVIPAGTPLAYRCPRSMVIDWVHFTAQVLGGLDLFACLACPLSYRPRNLGHTRSLLRRLQELEGATTAAAEVEASALVMQLLAPLLDLPRRPQAPSRPGAMDQVVAYIDAHLGEAISVASLAERAGLCREAFTRQFSAAFGRPPARFIRRRRIDAAQRELLTTTKPLAQIAAELGFADAFHFSRTFRAVTGSPPTSFRRQRAMQP